jgi:hypothetical protein
MRSAPLTTIKGGISRLRLKGGARADTLYDLLNGYVTEANTIVVRPGTQRIAQLDENTRGLTYFDESLHTFCHAAVPVPSGFTLHILSHPDATPAEEYPLEKIHFAEPFMGALYVVAEFEDGSIYHYWLQAGEPWEADHHYAAGALVTPSVPNGYVYQATRFGDPYPSWAPNVPRSDGSGDEYDAQSIIEPTVYNDFYYVCVATTGGSPQSGTTEPTWPTEDGAQVIESVDGGNTITGAPATTPPSTDQPASGTQERYGTYTQGPGGSRIVIP